MAGVRSQPTILKLVVILAALWAAQTYWFLSAGLRWQGDDVALVILLDAIQVIATTCLLGAIAASVDATLDGAALDMAAVRAETRERLRPLPSWAALFLPVWIGLFLAGRSLAAVESLGLPVWYLATFFAVPLVVLGDMAPAAALRESLRLLRGRHRESLAALLGIGLFGLLALVPGMILLTHAAASAITKHDRAVVREANSPGSNYTTRVDYGGDLPSGSAVVFRGRKIGEVLGSEQDGSVLRVRFHVEPGFGPTSTPGELMVETASGQPCLVLVPLGEPPAGSPEF
ncbi:MAG TPA: DUF6159 family protein [Solirubrobacterales bacterium]|nr:DUF6159 family protein [Solirubrobacterales bacterium]